MELRILLHIGFPVVGVNGRGHRPVEAPELRHIVLRGVSDGELDVGDFDESPGLHQLDGFLGVGDQGKAEEVREVVRQPSAHHGSESRPLFENSRDG